MHKVQLVRSDARILRPDLPSYLPICSSRTLALESETMRQQPTQDTAVN